MFMKDYDFEDFLLIRKEHVEIVTFCQNLENIKSVTKCFQKDSTII